MPISKHTSNDSSRQFLSELTDLKERVLEQIDFRALIEQIAPIKGSKTKCLWHAEETPSLHVYRRNGFCYGACYRSYDAIDLIQKHDNVDWMTALETLARLAGEEMPQRSAESLEHREKYVQVLELLRFGMDFYHARLMMDPAAEAHREYLRGRRFDEEIWKRWHAGAAGNKNELLAALRKNEMNISLALEIGLLREDEKSYYDWFHDRVVIPFLDGGRVVYMTGRTIVTAEPKYLHLRNSEFVRKTLYNATYSTGDLVIVEGPFDVWAVEALAPEGVSAVALMGLGHSDSALVRMLKQRESR